MEPKSKLALCASIRTDTMRATTVCCTLLHVSLKLTKISPPGRRENQEVQRVLTDRCGEVAVLRNPDHQKNSALKVHVERLGFRVRLWPGPGQEHVSMLGQDVFMPGRDCREADTVDSQVPVQCTIICIYVLCINYGILCWYTLINIVMNSVLLYH